MNRIYLLVLITILFSCKSPSQENKSLNVTQTVTNLQTSFNKKEEINFLNNFPKDFISFKNTFGWDDGKDSQEPLYDKANSYIDYWFLLLQNPKYKKYESQITDISKGGTWQADGVSYFQHNALKYIKNNKKYDLINTLTNKDAKSVLSFLFDSPNPKIDNDFVSNLDSDKQEIVKQIFSGNTSTEKKRSSLSTYENNKDFFIKSFDVNKDGIPDKIVSSKAYQGEDLFVFLGDKSGGYQLSLETTNFSEDGGNIIKDITAIPNSKGLMITTYFPDRGYYEKEYNIIPENNTWILRNTVYKTMSDVSEDAVKYICDVTQNLDITKSGWSDKMKSIPDENERAKKCRTEKISNVTKQYFIQDPDGFTNLRKQKNASSEILQKIKSGEHIDVLDDSGDWFLVKTKEGKEGYVHRTRIK